MTTTTTNSRKTPEPKREGPPPAVRPSMLDFHRLNPMRTPAWRWQAAANIAARGGRPGREAIEEVGLAIDYFRAMRRAKSDAGHAQVREQFASLVAAEHLHHEQSDHRHEMDARLLARQATAEIAQIVGVPADVIDLYAWYFFALPPEGTGGDWIADSVLFKGEWFGRDPSEHDVWRVMAVAGGPLVLDIVIGDYFNRPDPKPAVRHQHAQRARFLVRDQALLMRAAMFTVGWFENVADLFAHLEEGPANDPRVALYREQLRFLRLASWLDPSHRRTDTPATPPAPAPPPASSDGTVTAPVNASATMEGSEHA